MVRASHWRLATRTVTFGELPLLMGIVNVTPDSFSDGGRYYDPARAVEHGLRLASEGADFLDIGGESTRPYAVDVDADEQLRRVVPVVSQLKRQTNVPLSIDTRLAIVARAALDAGAEIINDVSGLEEDPTMASLAIASRAGVCVMHMQGTPQTMQVEPRYADATTEIARYLAERRDALLSAGLAHDQICLDPGIGFGKTHAHNIELMSHCGQFLDLGCPLLVGHSRKGFLGKLLGDPAADRTHATAGAAVALAEQGVHVVRVHHVRAVRETLLAWASCRSSPKGRPTFAS